MNPNVSEFKPRQAEIAVESVDAEAGASTEERSVQDVAVELA